MTTKEVARRALLGVLLVLMAAPPGALAQFPPPGPPPPPGAPAPPTFSPEELDQLLAPIALYPDALLAQILMASTYPLEVVQAARWVQANPNVKGPQLEAAMLQQPWDPSVKSLTAVPQVLAMMDQRLDWTQRLGDAFLAQQQGVMAAVQNLRARAQAAGYLQSTPQQTVVVEPQAIQIVPVSPQVIYVPVYDPTVVYGPWWYPAYPPFYWYPPGYAFGVGVLSFGIGIAVGASLWGGFNWHRHHVTIINVNHYNTFTRTHITSPTWHHDPGHRWGVPYHDPGVRQRFGQGPQPGAASREAFRGRAQEGRQQPAQRGFERRPSGAPGARVGGAPPAGGVARPSVEAPRQPELGRRRGAPGARVGGAPPGAIAAPQVPQAPRQPTALEKVERGGETRNFSDRGRTSRQSTGAATPAPSPPASRGGPGAPTPAPSAPGTRGGGGPAGGKGGGPKGEGK
jgi:hypothetical protein